MVGGDRGRDGGPLLFAVEFVTMGPADEEELLETIEFEVVEDNRELVVEVV